MLGVGKESPDCRSGSAQRAASKASTRWANSEDSERGPERFKGHLVEGGSRAGQAGSELLKDSLDGPARAPGPLGDFGNRIPLDAEPDDRLIRLRKLAEMLVEH